MLLLVIHSAAGGLALADILRYLHMLRVRSIRVQILPFAEGTGQTNIVVRVLGVGDVDTHCLVHQDINLLAQCEQAITNNQGILQLTLALRLIQKTEKYYMLYHNYEF